MDRRRPTAVVAILDITPRMFVEYEQKFFEHAGRLYMTRDELDALVADLQRAGVRVIRTEPRPYHAGEWQIVCWCENPAHFYTITGAKLFREAVHAGLDPMLPRGALDFEN